MISSPLHTVRVFLSGDGVLILPELELLLFALGIVVIDRWLAAHEKYWNAALALAGAGFAGFTLYVQHGKMAAAQAADPQSPGVLGFALSLLVDPLFLFFAALFLAILVLITLLSARFLDVAGELRGSYCALLLVAGAGAMLTVCAINVVVIFVGLQLMVMSCYKLLGFAVDHTRAAVARKNFAVWWACSSVTLALGFLLLYGDFQTTNLGRIGAILETLLDKGMPFAGLTGWHAVLALALLAAGTFFLIEAAPLHWLAPELYEFAPSPVAGFLSAAAKAAGLALLLRLFIFLFFFAQQKWIHVWGGVAILSLIWGNVAALRQRNVMRVLAYGAVVQAGFAALGLVAANETALEGVVYHIGAYAFAALGLFGVLLAAQSGGADVTELPDLRGLRQRSPALAWLLLLFALTLAGVPLTAGFVAKFYIVKGVFAGHPELALFAAANAALSAYVYGRIAAQAFRAPQAANASGQQPGPPEPAPESSDMQSSMQASTTPPLTISSGQAVALTISAFVSLAAGLYPAPFLHIASYVFGQ